jgi:hypothetical protein
MPAIPWSCNAADVRCITPDNVACETVGSSWVSTTSRVVYGVRCFVAAIQFGFSVAIRPSGLFIDAERLRKVELWLFEQSSPVLPVNSVIRVD